jgi:hypothetical protein
VTAPSRTSAASPEGRSEDALRILLLTTRDIGQRATGRIMVLRTHVDALTSLGHDVTVAVVSPRPPAAASWSRRVRTTHVRAPGLLSVIPSALRSLTYGDGSLNESLFANRSVQRDVSRLAHDAVDVIVVDSLRLFPSTVDAEVPVVVDLDDLLSLRYDRLRGTTERDPAAVLGFAVGRFPRPLRAVAGRIARLLLGWESRRIADRELMVCARASAVSLVSRTEVDILQKRCGRQVAWLPPAVPIPDEPVEPHDGLIFLGGLDYLPNLQALRWYRNEVMPWLDADDPRHVLHVVGYSPESARRELDLPGIILHGYVDDLHAALSRRLLVAPLVVDGGIKLKVLEGMAQGLPVAGTPAAFTGLDLPDDVRLEAESGEKLADLVRRLVADPALCRSIGLRARKLVRTNYSLEAAMRRWSELLADLNPVRSLKR